MNIMIDTEITAQLKTKYLENGFVHYRPNSPDYQQLVFQCYQYYLTFNKSNNLAFKNNQGVARHVIDIFRDIESPSQLLFKTSPVKKIMGLMSHDKKFGLFTHAKLSYKEPFKETNWYPHQDNGYKKINERRAGYALFICLESMSRDNGCLQLYPKSYYQGTLHHEKLIENYETNDGQMVIKDLNPAAKFIDINANAGDIILFHPDMIHQSEGSKSNSRRLALIAEIEYCDKLKLDDYGLPPILIEGKLTNTQFAFFYLFSFLNPFRIYTLMKKYMPYQAVRLKKYLYSRFNLR
jgi:ectoine hydroxylase-related dioxygenase (phytanoyl-CoA dioxygenase family)